jgi:hypothetical protein
MKLSLNATNLFAVSKIVKRVRSLELVCCPGCGVKLILDVARADPGR